MSYETVRRWVNHFGPMMTAKPPKASPEASHDLASRRGLSENRRPKGLPLASRRRRRRGPAICGQSKRNKHAALKLMRKLLKKYAYLPQEQDGHRRLAIVQRRGPRPGDRRPARTWAMEEQQSSIASADAAAGAQDAAVEQRAGSAQKFLSTHAAGQHVQRPTRSRVSPNASARSRAGAMDTWRTAVAAA